MIEQEKILHLNEVQKRKVCKLIKLECANYFEGNCDLLDRGVEVPCPQMISYSVLCRYFLSSVLPGDNALYAELLEPDKVKKCVRCGTVIASYSNKTKYCKKCARLEANRQKAEYARRRRANVEK